MRSSAPVRRARVVLILALAAVVGAAACQGTSDHRRTEKKAVGPDAAAAALAAKLAEGPRQGRAKAVPDNLLWYPHVAGIAPEFQYQVKFNPGELTYFDDTVIVDQFLSSRDAQAYADGVLTGMADPFGAGIVPTKVNVYNYQAVYCDGPPVLIALVPPRATNALSPALAVPGCHAYAPTTPVTTEAPPTEAPPTEAPPTEAPPTEAPPTEAPPTEVPTPNYAPVPTAEPSSPPVPVSVALGETTSLSLGFENSSRDSIKVGVLSFTSNGHEGQAVVDIKVLAVAEGNSASFPVHSQDFALVNTDGTSFPADSTSADGFVDSYLDLGQESRGRLLFTYTGTPAEILYSPPSTDAPLVSWPVGK